MRKFLFIFLFLLASCGDPCNCDDLNTDPFNSSTLASGCGCSAGKIYVPDMAADCGADDDSKDMGTIDIQSKHKVK